jgi:hypothetical protein
MLIRLEAHNIDCGQECRKKPGSGPTGLTRLLSHAVPIVAMVTACKSATPVPEPSHRSDLPIPQRSCVQRALPSGQGNCSKDKFANSFANSLALSMPCWHTSKSVPLFGTATVRLRNSFGLASSAQIVTRRFPRMAAAWPSFAWVIRTARPPVQ